MPLKTPSLAHVIERTIFARLFLPVVAFGLLLGSILVAHQYQGIVAKNVEVAAAVSQYSQRYVENALDSLGLLANMRDDSHVMHKAMAALQVKAPYFERIMHVGGDGRVIRAAPPGGAGLGYAGQGNATSGGSLIISRPDISPDTGSLIVHMEHILDDAAAGMQGERLVGEFSLEGLKTTVQQLVLMNDDRVLLTDAFGNLIVHPQDALVQQQTNIGHWPVFREAKARGAGGFIHTEVGRFFLTVVHEISGTQWVLLMSRPLHRVLEPVYTVLLVFLLGVAVLYVGLAVLMRREMRRLIVSPFKAFSKSMGELEMSGPGKLEFDELRRQKGFAELEGLAQTYARMATTVQERELALRESEERYRAIYENAQEGIYRVSAAGAILQVNPALVAMLGYDDEAAALQQVTTVAAAYADPSLRQEFLEQIAQQGRVSGFEIPLQRKDGTILWAIINARAIFDDQGQLHVIEGMVTDISARKEMEEALANSKAFFQAVYEGISEAVFIHDADDYRILGVNQHAVAMFGISADAMMEMTFGELSQGEPPYCQADAKEKLMLAKLLGPQHFEWRSKRQGEELFWTDISASYADINGQQRMIVAVRDISARKRMEAERHEAEARYRDIFENAPIAIFRSTVEGELLAANPEYASLLGYDYASELHTSISNLASDIYVRPENRDQFLAQLYAQGNVSSFETQLRKKDGEEIWVAISARLVRDDQGAPLFIEGFHVNITDRKAMEFQREHAREELERQVAERTAALVEANARLVELDRLKTGFLSSASHELRTPLTSILGFAKITAKNFTRHFLEVPDLSPMAIRQGNRISENLEIIAKEGFRLSRLVNDLLDINAIESGAMVWRDAEVDVLEVLEETTANARGMLPRQRIRLLTAFPPSLPTLHMDRDKLFQVMQNLLSNAIKFTDAGEITVSAYDVAPVLGKPRQVLICIQDTGPGIPSKALEAIFEKFYQVMPEGRAEEKPRGTGLGLAICREIVEHYGGRIWAESTLGAGTTFSLELPVHQDAKPGA